MQVIWMSSKIPIILEVLFMFTKVLRLWPSSSCSSVVRFSQFCIRLPGTALFFVSFSILHPLCTLPACSTLPIFTSHLSQTWIMCGNWLSSPPNGKSFSNPIQPPSVFLQTLVWSLHSFVQRLYWLFTFLKYKLELLTQPTPTSVWLPLSLCSCAWLLTGPHWPPIHYFSHLASFLPP